MSVQTVDPSVSSTPIPLDAEDLATVCVLCSHNCGLRVDVADGRITAVRGDDSSPITRGYTCNKAFGIAHYVEHGERTRHPLRRRPDGSFERISWETAIAEIAERLGAIRQQSPRCVGLVGVGGQANHMDGAYATGFMSLLGSRRWFNALAQEKTQYWLCDQWMMSTSPSLFMHPDQERARCLFVLGSNPRISNRGHNPNRTFKRFAEDPDFVLIVADPRHTETTRGAQHHIRLRPGTDAYMLLGMIATVLREGWIDADFVRDHTVGMDALRALFDDVDVEVMAQRCGVPTSALVDAARDFAAADGAGVLSDLATEQNHYSTLVAYLTRVLMAVTGNLGRAGGQVFFENISPPVRNGDPLRDPERALVSGIAGIRAIDEFGMFSPTLVSEEITVDHPERIRALIVEGANPVLSYTDTNRFLEAREQLDLLVVIDPAMTETARLADYVLPTPVGYEKWEFALFWKRWPETEVQVRPPVVPAPDETLPEPEIYLRLAEAMGIIDPPPDDVAELAAGALEPAGAMAYLGALQAASGGSQSRMIYWAYRTLGPHLAAPSLVAIWLQAHLNGLLRRDSVLRALGDDWRDANPFELAAELFRRILDHPEGVEIARANAEAQLEEHVGFEDRRIRLVPEPIVDELRTAIESEPFSDPEYPFVLATGLRTRWTANTIQREPAWRKGRGPHCPLSLSPGDAEKLRVADGDRVRVETRRGRAELPARIDKNLRDGHVWIPNGFGMVHRDADGNERVDGVNINELTDARERDPFTGCPRGKSQPCRLERV